MRSVLVHSLLPIKMLFAVLNTARRSARVLSALVVSCLVATPCPLHAQAVTKLASGESHVLTLREDGTVWAWGRNAEGQLGNFSVNSHSAPVQVKGLTGVVAIAAGIARGRGMMAHAARTITGHDH